MVSGIVVVVSAVVPAAVPLPVQLLHGGGGMLLDGLKETGFRFPTIPLPAHLNLQGLVQQILLGRHDVHQVVEGLGRMNGRVDVDVDPAARVHPRPRLPQLADTFLYGFDVLILADGGYKLYRIRGTGCSAASSLAVDTRVADQLPLPVLPVPDGVRVVSSAYMHRLGMKMTGQHLRGGAAGEAGHLDLYPEFLVSQGCLPPPLILARRPLLDIFPYPRRHMLFIQPVEVRRHFLFQRQPPALQIQPGRRQPLLVVAQCDTRFLHTFPFLTITKAALLTQGGSGFGITSVVSV